MQKIGIITDTNSGMTAKEAAECGVTLMPMPFTVNGREYVENASMDSYEFFECLAGGADVATSQPSPESMMDCWREALKTCERVIYIPMSSALSGSCQSAMLFAEDFDGRVIVVDNRRISISQKQSVYDALRWRDDGLDAEAIAAKLMDTALDASIYLTVDDLKYLKKGGRITPAAALVGTVLHMKPVLQIQGEKLDAFAKCRGTKLARKTMIDAIRKDISGRFAGYEAEGSLQISFSWSWLDDQSVVENWKQEILEAFPGHDLFGDPLALSIGCHIGPGALAVTVQHVLNRRTF